VVIDGGPGFSGAVVEFRLSGVDSHPSAVDSHPSGVDSRPCGLESRPSGVEFRPSGVDSHLSGVEVLPVALGFLTSIAPLRSFHLPHCSSWATIGAGVTPRENLGLI